MEYRSLSISSSFSLHLCLCTSVGACTFWYRNICVDKRLLLMNHILKGRKERSQVSANQHCCFIFRKCTHGSTTTRELTYTDAGPHSLLCVYRYWSILSVFLRLNFCSHSSTWGEQSTVLYVQWDRVWIHHTGHKSRPPHPALHSSCLSVARSRESAGLPNIVFQILSLM